MHRLTAYGHSWVEGAGATEPERCLVTVTARSLARAPDNRGVGGTLSTHTAELASRQQESASTMFLVMTGLNDARLHGSSEVALDRYSSALDSIFGDLRATNPESVIIAVEQPALLDYSLHPPHDRGSTRDVDAYNVRLRRAAANQGGVLLATARRWDARTMLAQDTVHPNDAGHAEVARAVAEAVAIFHR